MSRRVRSLAIVPLIVAVLAVPAGAATPPTFTRLTLTQTATTGLTVTPPLDEYVAVSRARVLVPNAWRRVTAPAGQLKFVVTQSRSCRYDVTFRTSSALVDPPASISDYVAAQLPAAGPKYLLDSGTRGADAFRVIRRPTTGSRVRLSALWAGVLTRRPDIVPAGKTALTTISAGAVSRAGSECHSGTWREALGPALGDALAVATNSLYFTRKPS